MLKVMLDYVSMYVCAGLVHMKSDILYTFLCMYVVCMYVCMYVLFVKMKPAKSYTNLFVCMHMYLSMYVCTMY